MNAVDETLSYKWHNVTLGDLDKGQVDKPTTKQIPKACVVFSIYGSCSWLSVTATGCWLLGHMLCLFTLLSRSVVSSRESIWRNGENVILHRWI